MDYNYVRMRNALRDGDLAKAEEYKLLYEGKKKKTRKFSALDYTILLLLCVSVLLGVYILHSQTKMEESKTVQTQEVKNDSNVDK